MNIGHLNIPKPEMESFLFVHDLRTKLYLQYSRLIENDGPGAQVLKNLEQDHRVQALDKYLIRSGSSFGTFEPKELAMWYLWAMNEYGAEIAATNLNKFLIAENVPVINTLWVLGIEVDEPIKLDNGIRILSIKDMPYSQDKEQYLKHNFDISVHKIPRPKAAITHECNVTKACKEDEFSVTNENDKEYLKSSYLLYDVALLLNAIEGISCIPYYSTSYTMPDMPFGMFSASGGGSILHDIYGFRVSKLTSSNTTEINQLLNAFSTLSSHNKTRMSRILSRLSQAKRREQIEDKMLDLGIALEMALLENNKDQLSMTFRLRGSWLVGSDYEDRQHLYDQLLDIYNYRSQVAHNGALCSNDPGKIQVVRDKFEDYTLLAEKIIRQLIYNTKPDWPKLILGGI